MSTFCGKIQEIPNISVDRFDGDNLKSEVYFLSHCHSDHMVGLGSRDFQNMLIGRNKFLYASDVSCIILRRMYPYIENNIRALDIYEPTFITIETKKLSVSMVSAGHCPGSVMFLFEILGQCILYTGDYRIHKNDIKKFKCFYDSFNKVKVIDKIYLDTTFFQKCYLKFPKREESVNELCRIIKDWTDRGKNYLVHLVSSAGYGYEYIFIEINKKIGMPVHVNYDKFNIYSIIPEMDNSVTVGGCQTQVHCNCGFTYQSICDTSSSSIIKILKISAFRWNQINLESGLSVHFDNISFICYSTHASYEEGVELLKFLKPKSIEACVIHDDPHINSEMKRNFIAETTEELTDPLHLEEIPKLFPTETNVVLKDVPIKRSRYQGSLLDSPPSVHRKIVVKESSETFGESSTLDRDNKQNGAIKSLHRLEKKEWCFEEEFGFPESPSKDEQKITLSNRNLGELSTTKIIEQNEDKTSFSHRQEDTFWSFESEFGLHDTSRSAGSKGETSATRLAKLPETINEDAEKISYNLDNRSSLFSHLTIDNKESTTSVNCDKDIDNSVIINIINS